MPHFESFIIFEMKICSDVSKCFYLLMVLEVIFFIRYFKNFGLQVILRDDAVTALYRVFEEHVGRPLIRSVDAVDVVVVVALVVDLAGFFTAATLFLWFFLQGWVIRPIFRTISVKNQKTKVLKRLSKFARITKKIMILFYISWVTTVYVWFSRIVNCD